MTVTLALKQISLALSVEKTHDVAKFEIGVDGAPFDAPMVFSIALDSCQSLDDALAQVQRRIEKFAKELSEAVKEPILKPPTPPRSFEERWGITSNKE
jgi:hypothetical protein